LERPSDALNPGLSAGASGGTHKDTRHRLLAESSVYPDFAAEPNLAPLPQGKRIYVRSCVRSCAKKKKPRNTLKSCAL
jgi:hypothetical protein